MSRRIGASAMMWLGLLTWPAAATATDLTYLVHEPAKKSAHPPLIILLHGSGADERDMIGLWSQLPRDLVVISPRAPFQDLGGGYRWYRRKPNSHAGKIGVETDIEISLKIIDLMVENAVSRFDADPKRLFIAGFSQGAVMVYEVALREPGRFRGAAVLSGTLFPSEIAKLPSASNWSGDSFFVAHGTADDRIPFSSATAARAVLARRSVPLEFHAYPGMRHAIGPQETVDLDSWLQRRIESATAK